MADLETTELKLKSTPTGGKEAHKSPYYRRLVSAGYKGFLQGTLGGGSLYGFLGLVIGGLVATSLWATGVGAAIFLLAPAFAGLGLWKGADTFGQIGSMAAITAESADMAEQRRYLLDMYYDLPNTPDGNARADAIKHELLTRATDQGAPPRMFHWKTVLVGAAIGAALVVGALLVTGGLGAGVGAIATKIVAGLGIEAALASAGIKAATFTAAALGLGGALAGALAGATIGIDRYYIRKWFDHTQDIVHPSTRLDYGIMERHRQVESIKEAAKADDKTRQQMAIAPASETATPAVQDSGPKAPAPKPVAALDKADAAPAEKPAHTISAARRDGLAAIQRAMEVPVV